ncbi:TPA: hypothetical protein ACX6PO_003793 [Photobacterium damselae]
MKRFLIAASLLVSPLTFANDFTGSEKSLVCVNLPVGVGYAASFYVTSEGGFKSSMSDKFNVGETKCIDVSDVTDGDLLTAHVEPKLAASGKIIDCDPAMKKVTGKAVTYKASGTVWNAWCTLK